MESDSKDGKNAEPGNKNSKRALKSAGLPSNLKPKFPVEKKKEEEKEEEIVIDNDKKSDENAHHSLSPAAEQKSNFPSPLKVVKTEEKLAKRKRSDYVHQPVAKSTDNDKESGEPHQVPSEPKLVKSAEKLKLGEKSPKAPLAEKTEKAADKVDKIDKDKHVILPIQAVPSKPVLVKAAPTTVAKESEVVKSVYAAMPGKTANWNYLHEAKSMDQKPKKAKLTEQKSKQHVNVQHKHPGFFKQIRMKFQGMKAAEIEAKLNPTPEQMAKPYVPAEYAFHIRSNDYKPDPLYFAKNRIFVPNDAPLNIQGDKGALFVNNRPFWLIKGMGAVKNPPRRTKVQMHKNLKKMYEGNKKALAPPQGRRDNFCDPKTASYELVKKKLGAEEWRFAERQMTANTFYATLFLEAEKARLDKEPKPAHLEEKKTSEKMLKFKFFDEKGAIVISENPPVNVPSFLYTYDRKERPGVEFLHPETRQFTACEVRIDGRRPVKKGISSTNLSSSNTSNSQSDSKKG